MDWMSLPPLLAGLTKPPAFRFRFTAPRITRATNRPVLEITIEGRPTAMHVPVTLINGNYLEPGNWTSVVAGENL